MLIVAVSFAGSVFVSCILESFSVFAGKAKVWQTRLSSYISLINFVMIFYLYIIENPLGLSWFYWFILMFVGVVGLIVFDTIFVMPYSLGYTFSKNPEFMELKNDVKEIKKEIEKIA